jgi:WhiB family transcriptional regulator, redox-sensing transcriptional regulator
MSDDPYADLVRAIDDVGTTPCRDRPELFFPEDVDRRESMAQRMLYSKMAKELCQSCPIRLVCLEYALAANEDYGIWGGLSAKQRKGLKRERNKKRREDIRKRRAGL